MPGYRKNCPKQYADKITEEIYTEAIGVNTGNL